MAKEFNVEQILKEGKVEVEVKRPGFLKKEILKVVYEQVGESRYPVLFINKVVEFKELSRLANLLQLPVKAPNGTAFPEGKSIKDFLVEE